MTALPADVVAAASAAWVWFPPTATFDETPTALVVRYPPWFDHALEVARFTPGPAADLDVEIDAALDLARGGASGRGDADVAWWVRLDTRDGVERRLLARGARLVDTVDVLACDLTGGEPDLSVPGTELEVRRVADLDTLRDSRTVVSAAFGTAPPPEDQLTVDVGPAREGWASGEGGALVAYLDGAPVGTGGVSVVDGVARLWSGSVVEPARGRGVYRALVTARLRHGVERGATLGLVKGRVATSGPILRRAGFEPHGQERCYLLDR